jgi:hypothetical protein
MVLPFFFLSSAQLDFEMAGPEETKNQRRNVLRLIQIRLLMFIKLIGILKKAR